MPTSETADAAAAAGHGAAILFYSIVISSILLYTDRLQLPLRVVHSPERAAQFQPPVTLPSRTGAAPFMKPHTQDLLD
jgi:hypothetical protein